MGTYPLLPKAEAQGTSPCFRSRKAVKRLAYQIMFYGGMAGAAVALVIAILVYVKLNIAQVITDLTGRNFPGAGRKARNKSNENASTGTKPITKEINVRKNVEKEVAAGEYVEPTEKMVSGSVEPTALLNRKGLEQTALLHQDGTVEQTELLHRESFEPTTLLATGNQQRAGGAAAALLSASGRSDTTLLADAPTETTILSDWEETTVLSVDPDETTLLDDIDETTLLTVEEPRFRKQVDIMIVHSNTII
jgi:hypothetical protein